MNNEEWNYYEEINDIYNENIKLLMNNVQWNERKLKTVKIM